MLVEICVDSLTSLKAAVQGGAHRVELCSALQLGGLTPSSGLCSCAKSIANLPVYCMVRCRDGDFVYDEDEMSVMLEDVRRLKQAGADGFVFGALTQDGLLDAEKCRRIIAACSPRPITLHRAFDHCNDWKIVVDAAVDLGFQNILTSGQKATALEGCERLKEIINYSSGRINIMAGSGITPENLPLLVDRLPGLQAVHGSASVQKNSMCLFKSGFKMGVQDGSETQKVTSADVVKKLVATAATK